MALLADEPDRLLWPAGKSVVLPASQLVTSVLGYRVGCSPWGVISPMYQAMMSSANSASDREIRIVNARAILRESSSLLPRERWRSAEPRLTTIAMSKPTTSSRNQDSILRPSVQEAT